MNRNLYFSLESSISKERLSKYSEIFNLDNQKFIIQKYLLNIEISKALYFPLQNLEITLRNNIHSTLSLKLNDKSWYDLNDFLNNYSKVKIKEAKQNIKKEKTSGRVISELNFGFWTGLFSKEYDQKIWSKYTKIIFPNIPKKYATRKILSSKIQTIRHLRNKVFHFDTIIGSKNLFEIHKEILEFIKWLNIEMYELTLEFDEFEFIYKNEEKVIKDKLESLNRRFNEIL